MHRLVACSLACALLVLALLSHMDLAPPPADVAIGPLSAAAQVSVTDAEQTAQAETETAAAANTPTETATSAATATDNATEAATNTPEPTATGTPASTATSTATTVPTNTPTTIPTATATPIPGMSLSSSSGYVGSTLRVQVRKFRPNSRVAIYYDGTRVLTLVTDQYGTARDGFIVPRSPAGAHTIRADGALSKTDSATFTVKPLLKLNVSTVLAGRTVTATVTGFGKSTAVAVRLYDGDLTTSYRTVARLTTSSTGTGAITFTVPSSTKAGTHTVLAVQSSNRDDATLKVTRPTNTPTTAPTKTPTRTPTPAPVIRVVVFAGCSSNPELTRITNNSTVTITVQSVGSIYDPRSGEPYSVSKALSPGQSITYQTGGAATSNVLTRQYIYNNTVGTQEGARVRTNSGTFEDRC